MKMFMRGWAMGLHEPRVFRPKTNKGPGNRRKKGSLWSPLTRGKGR